MSLRLSLRELEVFVAVCEALTVTRAASQLAMTQSAASQALSSLESGLGVALFDRVGRRLVANEHGRLLLPKARAMLDMAQEAQTLFSGTATHLRLGASTTIANYLLPGKIASFKMACPDARLALTVGNTEQIVRAVAEFRIDLGFIEGPCHDPDMQVCHWQQDELLVLVGRQHPFASTMPGCRQMAAAEWILREAGSGTRQEVERLLLPQLGQLNVTMELGDSEAIKYAIAAGLGISCLPRLVVEQQLQDGSLVCLPLPGLARPLYWLMHRDKAISRGQSLFLDHVGAPGKTAQARGHPSCGPD